MKGHKIKLALQVKPRGIFHDDDIPPSLSFRGIYSGQPEKLSPPPVKIPPCFLGLLLLVSSNSSVFFVLLQFLPCFSIWTKIPPLPPWGDGQNIYPCPGRESRL